MVGHKRRDANKEQPVKAVKPAVKAPKKKSIKKKVAGLFKKKK